MTVVRVTFIGLTCDGGCGKQFESTASSAVSARVIAGVAGWQYAEGRDPGRPNGPGVGKGQRQFDYCPDCWPTSYHARQRGLP